VVGGREGARLVRGGEEKDVKKEGGWEGHALGRVEGEEGRMLKETGGEVMEEEGEEEEGGAARGSFR
jgi:hypothetical protein